MVAPDEILADMNQPIARMEKYGISLESYINHVDDVDVLVLAGDLYHLRLFDRLDLLFKEGLTFAKHVLFVPGNHDFWKGRLCKINELKLLYKNNPNIHILDANFIEIDGVKIFGGCMWSNPQPHNYMYIKHGIADFKYVKLMRYEDLGRLWSVFASELLTHIIDGGVDVVVSHFLPHPLSIPERFKRDVIMNEYYCTDMERYMDGVKLWVHGHTHDSCDYVPFEGAPRIVCNPYGYWNYEVNENFNRELVIEI